VLHARGVWALGSRLELLARLGSEVVQMTRSLTLRQSAALGVAGVGLITVLSVAVPEDPYRRRLIAHLTPALPSVAHVLAVGVGLVLLALAPNLWRGTRKAVVLSIVALVVLAVLALIKGLEYEDAAAELALAALLFAGRRAFPLGSSSRPRPALLMAGIGAWLLAYCAILFGPLSRQRGHLIRHAIHHAIRQALHVSLGPAHLGAGWIAFVELLIACAVVMSVLTVRSWVRPAPAPQSHTDEERLAARALTEQYGEDSLSPYLVRPDKALHFAADGVLSYRVIGGTAVISGDPVGPRDAIPDLVSSFRAFAKQRGWHVAVWGASARHLGVYRAHGLRSLCAGEEAFVDPSCFTLEGRPVRKLRQSVSRIQRRGWEISVYEGRELDSRVESEVDAVESVWRAGLPRVLGFAMGMGPYESEIRPNDLYLLARSPEGELRGVMCFIAHRGRLSLDTMRRTGDTPNGLNEALVCRALAVARERGVPEVSLNYAGLAHLVRHEHDRSRLLNRANRACVHLLSGRFQLDRLVRFNDKFRPEWRPRYLVYESRAGLPRTVLRVLQAEGYLAQPVRTRLSGRLRALPRALPRSAHVDAAR
jgi:lysyl-tRNA synthetase, class II